MSRQVFINLPVEDLDRSVDFFTQLGFEFNPAFTDESATCMVLSDDGYVMLLVKDRFKEFTTKAIGDASQSTEVIVAVSADSKEEVDEIVGKALAHGGKPANDTNDQGFMYGGSFQDPDGHLWEVVWMDPSGMPA